MPNVSFRIEGLPPVQRRLNPSFWTPRIESGLRKVADIVVEEERSYVRPHNVTGKTERSIKRHPVERREAGASRWNREIHIGTPHPGARPLMYGWASESGKMPNVTAIKEWMIRKGVAASPNITISRTGRLRRSVSLASLREESTIKSQAYQIARAIQRRGYSFGIEGASHQHIDNFLDAWNRVKDRAIETFARTLAERP